MNDLEYFLAVGIWNCFWYWFIAVIQQILHPTMPQLHHASILITIPNVKDFDYYIWIIDNTIDDNRHSNDDIAKKIMEYVVSQSDIPIFVKQTAPTNEVHFVQSLLNSWASGITTEPKGLGLGYPNVGRYHSVVPGGTAGNIIRPFAIKVIANINEYLVKSNQHMNIIGCGGVNNGLSALSMIRHSIIMQYPLSMRFDLSYFMIQVCFELIIIFDGITNDVK